MKTIVIRPEIIGYHNLCCPEPTQPINKAAWACALLIPFVAYAGWSGGRYTARQDAPPSRAAQVAVPFKINVEAAPAGGAAVQAAAAAISEDGAVELQAAMDQNLVRGEFSGNGREQMTATLSNLGAEPLKLRISPGQVLECGRNSVVVVRAAGAELLAGKGAALSLQVAAVHSSNRLRAGAYHLSVRTVPKLDLLLAYAQEHPELSPAALQTAILAVTDNLPLSAVCKFTPAGSDLASHFDTTPFRAETIDILQALTALRNIGMHDHDIAMTIDPQLKVESMIEPSCRTEAMAYYGITAANEWQFWKNELLNGEVGTRHYALFGIARFYPDIAVDMLPTWAREKRTTHSFRVAAVQALAETQRPAALPVLQRLVDELGRNTELGRAALDAARYLTSRLGSATPVAEASVAFRGGSLHPL